MPLKRAVLPLLDHVDPMAAATGGANTVVFRPEGRYGYNTDVQGIVDALTEAGAPAPGTVAIIGAGATACSALAAVGELARQARTSSCATRARAAAVLATAEPPRRSRSGSARLEDLRQGDAVVPDLLISTVPAGAADFYARTYRGFTPPRPWPCWTWSTTPGRLRSPQAAAAAGAIVASGFAMLLHQAAAQVELMTGKPAPLEAMRAAGEAELGERRDAPRAIRPALPARAAAAVGPLDRVGRLLSPRSRSPAITPSTSAGGRFWLSLAFASIRLTTSSTPTIARSCPSMNAAARRRPTTGGPGRPRA